MAFCHSSPNRLRCWNTNPLKKIIYPALYHLYFIHHNMHIFLPLNCRHLDFRNEILLASCSLMLRTASSTKCCITELGKSTEFYPHDYSYFILIWYTTSKKTCLTQNKLKRKRSLTLWLQLRPDASSGVSFFLPGGEEKTFSQSTDFPLCACDWLFIRYPHAPDRELSPLRINSTAQEDFATLSINCKRR